MSRMKIFLKTREGEQVWGRERPAYSAGALGLSQLAQEMFLRLWKPCLKIHQAWKGTYWIPAEVFPHCEAIFLSIFYLPFRDSNK